MAEPELLLESPPPSLAPASGGATPARPLPSRPPTTPPSRRRWLRLAIVVVGLLAALVLLRRTVWAPEPVAVALARVERGRVEETVTNSRAGTVKARRRAQISPEVGGRVLELPFRDGDRVPAGDVLLRLDDSIVRAQVDLARRELALRRRSAPSLPRRRAGAARARPQPRARHGGNRLHRRPGPAQTAAATQAAGCEASRRGAERARAAVDLAQAERGRTVIRAPFDGIVADSSTRSASTPPRRRRACRSRRSSTSSIPDPSTSARPWTRSTRRASAPGCRCASRSTPTGPQLAGPVVRVAPYVLDREEQNRTVEIEVGARRPRARRRCCRARRRTSR